MNSGYQNDKDLHRNCFKWCGIAKLRKITIPTILQRGKHLTVCVCLSQYVCAWGSDEKRSFYDYESHVSSIWAPNSQAPARPYSGSATRRNHSSAFPIGDQSRGCCRAVWALPARAWCEALSYILGSGGATNDVLTDFTKLVIFMTKLIQHKELCALHRESRKVKCSI